MNARQIYLKLLQVFLSQRYSAHYDTIQKEALPGQSVELLLSRYSAKTSEFEFIRDLYISSLSSLEYEMARQKIQAFARHDLDSLYELFDMMYAEGCKALYRLCELFYRLTHEKEQPCITQMQPLSFKPFDDTDRLLQKIQPDIKTDVQLILSTLK